jgi:hypothetical protein
MPCLARLVRVTDQVPTWLYQSVHLTGTVRVLSDSELGPHLDALSAKFESWLGPKPPWTSSKMTAGRLDAMKKAIVGLVMTVEQIEGSFKLNQHKSDVDHASVTNALGLQGDAGAKAIGEQLVALRPHLTYISPLVPLNLRMEGMRHDPLRTQGQTAMGCPRRFTRPAVFVDGAFNDGPRHSRAAWLLGRRHAGKHC